MSKGQTSDCKVCQVVTVEDDAEIAELIRVVLASPGIEIHTAENGDEGLALIQRLHPDLIVLDVMMPGTLNGWDIYDAVRADAALHDIPAIMLSVLRESPERRRAFAHSPRDLYMTKPFDTLMLREAIQAMLGRDDLWDPPHPQVARAFMSFRQVSELDIRLDAGPVADAPSATPEAPLSDATPTPDDLENPQAILAVVASLNGDTSPDGDDNPRPENQPTDTPRSEGDQLPTTSNSDSGSEP